MFIIKTSLVIIVEVTGPVIVFINNKYVLNQNAKTRTWTIKYFIAIFIKVGVETDIWQNNKRYSELWWVGRQGEGYKKVLTLPKILRDSAQGILFRKINFKYELIAEIKSESWNQNTRKIKYNITWK